MSMSSRIWNATRVSSRSLLMNCCWANIQIRSRVCSAAIHSTLRPARLSWLNTSNYNLGRPGFSSLTEAQFKDQYSVSTCSGPPPKKEVCLGFHLHIATLLPIIYYFRTFIFSHWGNLLH